MPMHSFKIMIRALWHNWYHLSQLWTCKIFTKFISYMLLIAFILMKLVLVKLDNQIKTTIKQYDVKTKIIIKMSVEIAQVLN